jgi:prophage regulatory protein
MQQPTPASLSAIPTGQPENIRAIHDASKRKASAARLPLDPATTLIRMPELLAATGLGGRATVYKLLKDDPTFPKPVPLTTSSSRNAPVAWVLAEVQGWIRTRIAARGNAA